jgi:glucan biosynthesis protein
MNTTETRQRISEAVAARTAAARVVQTTCGTHSPRKRAAARRALEAAEAAVDFAVRDHEQAVRAANPDATQAQIMDLAAGRTA